MIGSFLLGAIAGGAAMWIYGDRIRAFLDDKTRAARTRAADTLQAASAGLRTASEKIESGFAGGEGQRRGG